ncbi:macrolide 2'-phosphotransferase [Glutamicibacter ardleyensis]|nr:macrolide 2'-phosphotransferase [Glutamicibacter ardleyensis]
MSTSIGGVPDGAAVGHPRSGTGGMLGSSGLALYFSGATGKARIMEDSAIDEICALAEKHGLELDPHSLTINELGLDFQVAIGTTNTGDSWVLRIPRRPDVTERAAIEGRLLRRLAPHLDVAIPDWKIHSDTLIAYPLLPGEPGLTLTEEGQPQWHFALESREYAHSLADFLAQLHAVDPTEVIDSGIEVFTPSSVRQQKREDITRVVKEFEVSAELQERWSRWLADDRYWPEHTTLTHGEIYPAHQLMTGERIDSILDWTTAAIGDPARDFVFHHASVSATAFNATVDRYVAQGGVVGPLIAEHCVELFSTAAVDYGLFALQTGNAEHLKAAAAQLNP